MYTHAVGDEVMVEVNSNIAEATPWYIRSIEDYNIKVELKDNDLLSIMIPKELVFPILTITDANQWQIQKNTIRAISQLLKQQKPEDQ